MTDRKSLPPDNSQDLTARFLDSIRAAIRAGANWIQIREKDLPGAQLLALVRGAAAIAHESRTQIYVNDRVDVAAAAHAHGVHLGGQSLPVADVVRWRRDSSVQADLQIGVSCHGVDEAKKAEHEKADYIFFGPIFDTPSKRRFGPPQGLEALQRVCASARIPVIAIGGINETNAEDCLRAGASGIAAIRLFQQASDALRSVVASLKRKRSPNENQ